MKKIAVLLAALIALCTCACTMVVPGGQNTDLFGDMSTKTPFFTEEPTPAPTAVNENLVYFDTTDINGSRIALDQFAGSKVIMINFFETWCPPCMGELPDLQATYVNYKNSGLVILGVYSSSSLKEVLSTVQSVGMTYPVFEVTENLSQYQTQYVPTTVFFNSDGELLTDEPVIGSMNGEQWDELISSLLENN